MCGIAGYAGFDLDTGAGRDTLRRMCSAIEHRGPDEEGIWVGTRVGLGMRRLSIIDVEGGQQPIENEDGTVRVVFNGEIYNHHELRRELSARGHSFRTRSDTEVLVHLYEEHAESLVTHLRGMFSFALWDETRQRLFCARDRLGIKPLAYWVTEQGLAFCSELRSLVALEDFPKRISREAVAYYLAFGYVPDPFCVFEGVSKVPPGHCLSWTRGTEPHVWRYWDIAAVEERPWDEGAAKEELSRLLAEAVVCRLESEVPLGAFLSGGVDSSTVTAIMARHLDRPVQTFAIGFGEGAYNEAPDARAVATSLRTTHTELVVRPDVDRLIEGLIGAYDEPFADSSAIPTYLVSRLAREHVTVVLSGDGGDELFGGYTRYAKLLRRREMPRALRSAAHDVLRHVPHAVFGRNFLLDRVTRSRRGQYATQVLSPVDEREGGVAATDLAAVVGDLEHALDTEFDRVSSRDFGTQMMLVDLATYLPGDILTKVDRASMAVSLEARVPLLDHHLVEFAMSLPASLKFGGGRGKKIFREVAAALVPPETLSKPKQGFAVPLPEWFRGPLQHRLHHLLRSDDPVQEYVRPEAVRRLVREHLGSRRDHATVLWRLLVLSLWLRHLASGQLSRTTSPDLATLTAGS